ncbi:putative mitochondrial protein (mitochondrion) [Arabidopsis thaliana]|uniref:Uncharacterized mitochondrial protein AtMg00430/AtMg01150 n=4 Tax=Arabidopsis TaxID=3701 RepID=M430_ARATH|nr:uncharacterized protein AT2G07701 [Arabidopsis thaliana]P93299.1 RecName: Full=Uncharacterized mitochondrial protein AtMg00430/AtMg01150; AltName: Full=ORF106a/ORF106g [Arabidopsis thaliana]KAG7527783.1 hypothetical protein ISN44_Un263g000020 [Arabidopsis suecica]KAG7529234.1 hypothetical protein ISN45_Un97g000150 [Arabidopsis thaliana x Arabidopsis arenosa]AAM15500.1 hypothetical protein [Arabidopsis thaliana]AEC06091.1 hypothetical protein AT2G07701 [Arabidopsis thaliana]KAG7527847.1 hyp|eukprot:NP_178789.1 hypothetical protein AT2G07701 [Arabidopsis thaliana]
MLHRGRSCLTGLFPCYLLSNWLNSNLCWIPLKLVIPCFQLIVESYLLEFLLLLAISTCLLGEDSLIWLTLVVAHSKSRQSSSQEPLDTRMATRALLDQLRSDRRHN